MKRHVRYILGVAIALEACNTGFRSSAHAHVVSDGFSASARQSRGGSAIQVVKIDLQAQIMRNSFSKVAFSLLQGKATKQRYVCCLFQNCKINETAETSTIRVTPQFISAQNGHEPVVGQLLKIKDISVNKTDNNVGTPLDCGA